MSVPRWSRVVAAVGLAAAACTGSAAPDTAAPPTSAPPPAEVTVAPTTTTPPSTTASTNPPLVDAADIVLHNAVVLTMDAERTMETGIALVGGDIVAVGADAAVLALAGPRTVVADLGGRTVIPGIVEPHTHLLQLPAPDVEGMHQGQQELLAGGITTAGMPSVEPEELEAFRALDDAGELVVRTHLYVLYNSVCGDRPFGDFYRSEPFSQDPDLSLAVAGVKIFMDGGVCNAPAVSFTYPDSVPESLRASGWVGNGTLYADADEVASVISEVDEAGGQVVIHGIGDEGIRTALAGMEAAHEGGLRLRHRLDHNSFVGLLTADELAGYGRAAAIPVIQLMPWSAACDDGRTELWRSLLPEPAFSTVEHRGFIADANPGITFAWHGDQPFNPASPLQQMFSVVTGGSVDPATGIACYPEAWDWFPTVSVEDALAMMTIHAAEAMLLGDRVGSLEVGKAADLLVLEHDLLDADPEVGIAGNRPLVTMIGGVVRYCDGVLCGAFEAPPQPPEGGWVDVDHPVVASVRASRELTPAAHAVDGDSETAWVSGDSSPQWIELDLGAELPIRRLRLLVDQDPAGFTIHQIFAGPDPAPTTLVAEMRGETEWGQLLEVDLDTTARYVRIETPDSPSWVSWLEIDIDAR